MATTAKGAADKVVENTQPAPMPEIQPTIIEPVVCILDPENPEKYRLRLTNRAMKAIEAATGINMWNGIGSLDQLPTAHFSIIVWQCLKWEHRDITIEDVDELPGMDISNMFYVLTCIDKLLRISFPEPDPNAKTDPNANPSVGSNTGQPAA